MSRSSTPSGHLTSGTLSDPFVDSPEAPTPPNPFADAVRNPVPEPGYLPPLPGRPFYDTALDDPRIMQDPVQVEASTSAHRLASLQRVCFVTVGATASFKALIDEVLSDDFLDLLKTLNFTQLIIQCGPDLGHFEKSRPQPGYDSHWLHISGFDLTTDMKSYMLKACEPRPDKERTQRMGVIIAHAGAGTILDALKINTKLIVVPNPTLMDDHQTELAREMERQGYLTWGRLGSLKEALTRSEVDPPPNWPPRPPPTSVFTEGVWQTVTKVMQGPDSEKGLKELAKDPDIHQVLQDGFREQSARSTESEQLRKRKRFSKAKENAGQEDSAKAAAEHGGDSFQGSEEKLEDDFKMSVD